MSNVKPRPSPALAKSRRAPSANGGKHDVPAVAELQALLRTAGLRSTAPRIAVLQHLHRVTGPNSHAELFAALADQGFDRATIYRNLMDLAEAEIVTRTDLGDHVWRFELKTGVGGAGHTDEHPHFVCIDCGEVSCLPGVSIRISSEGSAPKAVGDNSVHVQLKGVCDNCS